MQNIHIVTDSSARFVNKQVIQQYPITIVPNRITLDGKVYREDVDLNAEDVFRRFAQYPTAFSVASPTVQDYMDVFARLSRYHDAVISIHPSRELYPSWQNAKTAVQQMAGHCEIAIIDSQTICAAQAMLVRVAARISQEDDSLDSIIRTIRGVIDRLYSVYYVDTLDYLLQNKIMSASQSILGTYLGIKPFLVIENGHLVPIEKVRTQSQAIEQLVEFLVEFTDIEDIAILQHKTHLTEQTRLLQDRLMLEYPRHYFPYATYSLALAALIGTDAIGVVVLEEEDDLSEFDDGF